MKTEYVVLVKILWTSVVIEGWVVLASRALALANATSTLAVAAGWLIEVILAMAVVMGMLGMWKKELNRCAQWLRRQQWLS